MLGLLCYFWQGGVLFKGNLRGQAAKSYEKIAQRMQVSVAVLLSFCIYKVELIFFQLKFYPLYLG